MHGWHARSLHSLVARAGLLRSMMRCSAAAAAAAGPSAGRRPHATVVGRLVPAPVATASRTRGADAWHPLHQHHRPAAAGAAAAALPFVLAPRPAWRATAALSAHAAPAGTAADEAPPPPAAAAEAAPATAYKLVTFYCFVATPLTNPRAEVERHKEFCKARDIRSRIYINEQGINAQLSGRGDDAVDYARWVTSDPRFAGTRVSVYDVPEHGFPKLTLRYKSNLVQLNGGTRHLDLSRPDARARHLSPAEWKAKLLARRAGAGPPLLLDVRNTYEWDAGRFEGAPRPPTECFRETVEAFSAEGGALDGVPRDTPIMMYCTGGIRCDVYSAVLAAQGFKELYTLSGGVQAYLDAYGNDMWDGHLFVFDSRLAMTPDRQPAALRAEATLKCHCCGEPRAAAPHRNCPNVDCNRLFLVCAACLTQHSGFCCDACANAAIVRPALVTPGRHYGRLAEYAPNELLASRRGEGRRMRRLRRRERKQEVEMQEAILAAAAALGVDFRQLTAGQVEAAAAGLRVGDADDGGDESGTAARRSHAARIAAAFATLRENGGVVAKRRRGGAAAGWDEDDDDDEDSDGSAEDEDDETEGAPPPPPGTGSSRHAKYRRRLREDAAKLLLAARAVPAPSG